MTESITSHLSQSAAGYARRALESFATDSIGDFVLLGGIAVEHAVKAKLTRANSVFIAKDGNFKSAMALHAAAEDVTRLLAGVPTVGGAEALQRLSHVEPSLGGLLQAAQELIVLRNGEAHLAMGDETQRRRVFVVFLRTIEALLKVESSEFWAPHYELVRTTLDDHAVEIERTTAALISAALIEFERRYGSLEDALSAASLRFVEDRRDAAVNYDETYPIDCPACQSPALAAGTTEETDWDVDFDKYGDPEDGYPILTFYASEVRCDACALFLEDSETIEAAGMASSWENSGIDVAEWMRENYEPEEY